MQQVSVWDFCPWSAELWTYKQDCEVIRPSTCPSSRETSDVSLQQLNIPHIKEKDVKTEAIVPATWDEQQLQIAARGWSALTDWMFWVGFSSFWMKHWKPDSFTLSFFWKFHLLVWPAYLRSCASFIHTSHTGSRLKAVARCPVCWVQCARYWEGLAASCRNYFGIFSPLSTTDFSFFSLVKPGIGFWGKAHTIQK